MDHLRNWARGTQAPRDPQEGVHGRNFLSLVTSLEIFMGLLSMLSFCFESGYRPHTTTWGLVEPARFRTRSIFPAPNSRMRLKGQGHHGKPPVRDGFTKWNVRRGRLPVHPVYWDTNSSSFHLAHQVPAGQTQNTPNAPLPPSRLYTIHPLFPPRSFQRSLHPSTHSFTPRRGCFGNRNTEKRESDHQRQTCR